MPNVTRLHVQIKNIDSWEKLELNDSSPSYVFELISHFLFMCLIIKECLISAAFHCFSPKMMGPLITDTSFTNLDIVISYDN